MGERDAFALSGRMRRIAQRKRFRDDLKRQTRRGKDINDLIAVVEFLAEQGVLPPAYRPHKLSSEWRGVWECHIEPDWLLIYTVTEEVLLIRTGTHADLFT
jgi:mRNA interferase YafQ